MGVYAMTGGATGIGAELKTQLLAAGHEVISVDIKEGDIIADLSTAEGRETAVRGIRERAPEGLDGYIPCAGLPPVAKPLSLIARVNYFAVVETVAGLRDLLGEPRSARPPSSGEYQISWRPGGDYHMPSASPFRSPLSGTGCR